MAENDRTLLEPEPQPSAPQSKPRRAPRRSKWGDGAAKVGMLKPRGVSVISQEDLEEVFLLTRNLREAKKEWREKREYIQAALGAGAEIERGVHGAAIVSYQVTRGAAPQERKRLIVR